MLRLYRVVAEGVGALCDEMGKSMRYTLAFASCFGSGSPSAASEMDAQDSDKQAETPLVFSRSGNPFKGTKERAVESPKNALGTRRFVEFAALFLSLMAGGAAGQAGAPLTGGVLPPARLTIVNPKHRDIPEDRARVLLLTTCHVVAEEFHRHPDEVDLKLTLVVGDGDEHYTIDHDGQLTLYLDRWNETRFVEAVITGAMQKLTPPQTRKKMLIDILRRSDRIAPVSVNELQGAALVRPSPGRNLVPDCFTAVRDGPCPWPNQAPGEKRPPR